MYLIINGMIEFVEGRTLSINGLEIDIPKEGFAYIAAELVLQGGKMMTKVVELTGESAKRCSFMMIGQAQFEAIMGEIEKRAWRGVDFAFASSKGRRKVSEN